MLRQTIQQCYLLLSARLHTAMYKCTLILRVFCLVQCSAVSEIKGHAKACGRVLRVL